MTSSLNVLHALASVREGAAGPSRSVPRLCKEMSSLGINIELHTVEGWRDDGLAEALYPDRQHRQSFAHLPLLQRMCLSRQMATELETRAKEMDVLHGHGLWLGPNHYLPRAARMAGRPYMVSPRGMLGASARAFSGLQKTAMWHLWQRAALAGASCLHATSEGELSDIRAAGIHAPVAVIPNGIDVPELDAPGRAETRTLLSLGRIHPKKGLANLVRAWAQVEARFPGWELLIAGVDELNHQATLEALAKQNGLQRVCFPGEVFAKDRDVMMARADVFILPSLHENFAQTVGEALAAGTPVIASTGAPWRGLGQHGCGWWIDPDADSLAATLAEVLSLPRETLDEMGARGRNWIADEYSWEAVAKEMISLYEWLSRSGPLPSTVRLS